MSALQVIAGGRKKLTDGEERENALFCQLKCFVDD